MKNTFILILLLAGSISCNTKEDSSSFKKFPNQIELKGNKIKTNQKFKSTNIVGIIDSILIVEVDLNDYAFYFFNINNFRLIKKFGGISRGPGEFPGGVSASYLDKNKKILFASNRARSIIYKAPVDSILERDNYTPKIFMKIPPKYSALDGLTILNDTTIIITGILNYDLLILNRNGEIIKKMGQLPSKPSNIKSSTYRNFYTRTFTYNEQNENIALGYYHKDKIIVYDLNGNKKAENTGPDFLDISYKDLGLGDTKKSYRSLICDERFIYALYSGEKTYEIPENANSINDINLFYPRTIHAFNWKGEPVLNIKLSHGAIDLIIDNKNDRIITVSLEDETIVTYNIKNIRILQSSYAANIYCTSPGINYCPLNPELGSNYTVVYGPGLDK